MVSCSCQGRIPHGSLHHTRPWCDRTTRCHAIALSPLDAGNEPSQTATYRVEAGDEAGNDQEPTQGMEASPARMQTAPTEAPPTVTSSSPPESAASHRADSLITLRAESDVTEADATARDDNEGEQPVCRDAVRSGSAAQQQGDTQQASAAHTSSVSKEVRAQVHHKPYIMLLVIPRAPQLNELAVICVLRLVADAPSCMLLVFTRASHLVELQLYAPSDRVRNV